MSKTYLQLVNDAIRESGTHLDSLTSSNFATAGEDDPMYDRFKNWVATAWKMIQIDRNEWEFKSKRATINISPRMYVEDGDHPDYVSDTSGLIGSVFEGDETETQIEVVGMDTLEGDWAAGTAKAFIDFIEPTGMFKFNENFDEVTPDPLNIDCWRVVGWGRYNLADIVTDLSEPNLDSFHIQSTGGSSDQTNDGGVGITKLTYVPWSVWVSRYESSPGNYAQPEVFTTTPEGYYDFWPRPGKQYTLSFNYLVEPSALTLHGDIPSELAGQYHDVIMWRAVMFYAEYDRQWDLHARAKALFDWWMQVMNRNLMPKVSFGTSRYSGGRRT